MTRRARLILSGVPQHFIQRGNNREATFFAEEDYRGWPLGGERFEDEIARKLKCATRPRNRGRPARSVNPSEREEPFG